ncbi:protein FAM163A [Denticeps clupeoides]|uniref:Uncharacterized protein n=1 Tax=Denticeps clupeoides TaxID=299321 RepID=A0AAY3ZXW9_9TELE|nr:protein FAM163A-like [Denticeps clupeoides]XP_028834056.1 protein FAM163A-like [Denticeps clupeoides]XP_028834057.1 protein FAM163A-like [Denticeps clupeoides]XP_028834058.1 protein FAM163A-like [Denticeps clupeoides]XP_028834059.1 protein FAM163A-like [Denticeps clupeoides]XP_028834061.1 protein FAM163A-like [Denticeps clupeoides]XP_028834062.1 protein FAM163A-like [Denticeps clupeoides]XP_028834063.1 protein FAM163A-like [Denticeps clupeoides]XP_028834064.1 protein FAM163A-like [Dentic
MTAGTVVITGGILATVILLCIIAVLCYCRLQYYCCRKNESEGDMASDLDPEPHFACNACSALGMDGPAVTPLALPFDPAPRHAFCPTCSSHYVHSVEETRNGGERLGFVPTYYENPAAFCMSPGRPEPLRSRGLLDAHCSTRAISTDV